MAKNAADPCGLNARQRALVDALPAHGWNISEAGQAVGYSRAYALTGLPGAVRDSPVLAAEIERKRYEIAERNAVTAAEIIAGLRKVAYDESANNSDRLRAFELLGKSIALFAEKVVTATEDLRIVLRRPVDAEVVDESPEQRPQLRLRHAAQSPQTAE